MIVTQEKNARVQRN